MYWLLACTGFQLLVLKSRKKWLLNPKWHFSTGILKKLSASRTKLDIIFDL